MSRSALLVAALLGAASLPAQVRDHLIGITRQTPVLRHQDHWNCAPLNICPPAGFPNAIALPPWAGGTGWDPTTSGAWITNGQVLAKVDDACNYQCPPMPFPGLPVGVVATGLEVVESRNQLWMIDSAGVLHFYGLACPPVPQGACQTGLMPGPITSVTSGLAVDEGNGLVFIAYPDFATGLNMIVVSPLTAPCQSTFRFPLPACPGFGTVTGLACDWGRTTLYATDGTSTVAVNYTPMPPGVVITGVNCCLLPGALEPMIGLAVRPARAVPMGAACSNGSCAPCAMQHTLRNDPNLGNAAFALSLAAAPANQLAWCAIGAGPCTPPGLPVPPLCAPLLTPGVLGTIGPVFTGGTGPCTGSGLFPLPLPVIPGLVGAVLSSQCLVLCNTTLGIGTSVSNCLTFVLQGN